MYSDIYDMNNLYYAFRDIYSKSGWKYQTQLYESRCMHNLVNLHNSLKNHTYKPKKATGFITNERGKPRWITSRIVDDRIVQSVVHKYIVLPAIFPKIIYDNAASLEHRGVDFFRRRLLLHLSNFAKQYGTDGYVLLIDFSKFFDNIQHEKLIDMFRQIIPEKESMDFVEMLINTNAIDVSYMSSEEYSNCMNMLFCNIDYRVAVENGIYQCNGTKYMRKSMDIGSQLSQDAGIYYPHDIDNYCKIVRGIEGYGRYMDDAYLISNSKEFIYDVLYNGIIPICNNLGIFLNPKKTQVVPLKHEFSILHTRYILHENGDVTIMPNNSTFQRERRKIDKQSENLNEGISKLTYDDAKVEYLSWRGNVCKYSSQSIKAVQDMNNRFLEDFDGYVTDDDIEHYFNEITIF